MKVSKKSHRLALRFSESDPPRLEKTCFWFGQSQSPVEQSFDGTVKGLAWDRGAMSLCYWLIQYRLSKHHPDDGLYEVPQDCQTELFDTLLNLLDSPRQFDDVFGKESGAGTNARAVLKLIFPQPNPRKHLKATIDPAQLAADALIIKRGTNDVVSVSSLKKLLSQIADAYAKQPSRKKEESEKTPALTPTIPPPHEPVGDMSATATAKLSVHSEETIRAVIKSLVAETQGHLNESQMNSVPIQQPFEIGSSIGQSIGPNNLEFAVNVTVSESVAGKPDFSPFLRNIIDEFTDLPALPGGIKNLALCDIINLKVQFPPKPPGLTVETENNSRTRSLPQAVGEERAWLLIGEGGQGKSTALRFLAHHFAKERLAAHAHNSSDTKPADALIPIHLTLSRREKKLIDQIGGAFQQFGLSCETETMGNWLRSESFLFLFDRLDETDSHMVLDEMVELLRIAPKSRVVLASRPVVMLSKWPFPQARLQPLNNSDIQRLLTTLLDEKSGNEMFDALIRHQSLDAFRRPLFARLLALSSSNLINEQRFTMGQMLRDVLEKRFLGLWERRSESNIEIEFTREILAWLGYLMVSTDRQAVKWETALLHGVTCAKIRGIQTEIRFVEELFGRLFKQGLLERNNDELQFWHSNFRDYFAAIWLEQNASKTSIYLKSWSPRWHEPIIFLFGNLAERRLSEEIKFQLLGAGLMIKMMCYDPPDNFLQRLLFIPRIFLYVWLQIFASWRFAPRLFFLLRMLVQSDSEHANAKKRLIKSLPRYLSYFHLQGVSVPVIYDSEQARSAQPVQQVNKQLYFCELVGRLRIPEAVEYLKTLETDFATVAPGLLYEPSDEIVSHAIDFIIAEDSPNGGWSNPRSHRVDRRIVSRLIINSRDPRFFLKLKQRLTATDPRIRAKLLETLTDTLYWYRDEDELGLLLGFKKRWIPILNELALRDEDGDVRIKAVSMLQSFDKNRNLPDLALPVFLEALHSTDSKTRHRAHAAIPGNTLMQHSQIAWWLLEDSDLEIVFPTLTNWFIYRQLKGFNRAVLKVLKRYADQNADWKQAASAIALKLRAERSEARLHSRCLGLLICATLYGPYNGFVLNAVRALGTLRLKWTSSLLMEVFYDKENWIACRREALRILVYILLRNEGQRLVLDGLKDNEDDIRALAAHLAAAEYFDAEFHRFVGPILFNLLKDASKQVQQDAAFSLRRLGYLAEDWLGFHCGNPVYLGPPESQTHSMQG